MPRVNINVSEETKQYFEELSKETGATQSSLMSIAIKEYMNQRQLMSQIPMMLEQMKVIEGMKELKK